MARHELSFVVSFGLLVACGGKEPATPAAAPAPAETAAAPEVAPEPAPEPRRRRPFEVHNACA